MQQRSLLDYGLILYKRRFAIYLVILTSVASALLIGAIVRPVYEARAAFYIPSDIAAVSYTTDNSGSTLARAQNTPLSTEAEYKPYLGMLKSLQLAQMVNAQYPTKPVIKLLRSDVDFEITDELVIRVYSRDPDPVLAANVANAYVDGLNRILDNGSQAQVAREPDYINSALGRVKTELKAAESELKRFEQKHNLTSLDTELKALSNQKSALQEKQDDTSVQIVANRGKQTALVREIKREGQDFEVSELAMTSPEIEYLRKQLADLMSKLAEQQPELGKKNLQLIELQAQKENLEQRLNEEIKGWLSSRIKPETSHLEKLRQQLISEVIEGQRLEATSKGNQQSLRRLDERLRPYPEIKNEWTELDQNVGRLRKMQQQLRTDLKEAQLQAARRMHLVVQLDHAEPPPMPAFPIWWLNTLIALFGGSLVGIGYAFFLNYVEETRKVRTLRLVRTILGQGEASR